jgi:uncharacterized Zn finger protein
MAAITHTRLSPRRTTRLRSWWARTVLQAAEESAYSESDLKRGRSLARTGEVGEITVAEGEAVAAVLDGDEAWSVRVAVRPLDAADLDALVEVVAAGSGWLGALLRGALPEPFLEAAEEAGVAVPPDVGDLEARCSCEAWTDPCPHALALLNQLAWLVDADPFVLTQLRGLGRDAVLARLAEITGQESAAAEPDDLTVALEAAERAARVLGAIEAGGDVRRWL